MPLVALGPYTFSSGYNPQTIGGPLIGPLVVEHAVPNRAGGIVQYVATKQPRYIMRGFIAPPQDGPYNGTAGAVLSQASYVSQDADAARTTLLNMRGSGAQLLRIESTWTNLSGYPILYEQDFFNIESLTFGYEAGRAYPYYPYSIELRRAPTKTFGDSSGTVGPPIIGAGNGSWFSGYAYAFTWRSGFYRGGLVIGLGFNVNTVASGSARMAVYNVSGPQGTSQGLVAQSASQPITSGFNYFPIRPILLTMASGNFYMLGLMTNVTNNSGFSILNNDLSTTSGTAEIHSGVTYSNGFPDPFINIGGNGLADNKVEQSGIQLNMVMVTA